MKKIIVAVSGGPDSMALLHMMNEKKYQIVAAHVNYNVRENSSDDQKVILDYIQHTDIDFHVLTAPKHTEGNFQAFAREVRYNFMVELANQYEIDEMYVAHHEDDHIETYLMQKERGSVPSAYGLSERSTYKGVSVVRPLLQHSKQDLVEYCQKHNLRYVVDESNLENDYTRNFIRNTIVTDFDDDQRREIVEDIKKANEQLKARNKVVDKHLQAFFLSSEKSNLIQLSDEDMVDVLRKYLRHYDLFDITNAELENIVQFIRKDGNGEYRLSDQYVLSKAYDLISVENGFDETYEYTFHSIEQFECDYFKISFDGKSTEAVTLQDSDFPITIRNYREGDEIKMRFGTKKVNRFFIDRKIPDYERKLWPIVENASNEIILVPQLGCNLTHYSNNPSMFVVK